MNIIKGIGTKKPIKAKKPAYKKPLSIKQLETDLFEAKVKKHPYIERYQLIRDNLRDDTANALTNCIVKYLTVKGYFAARVNTMGNFNRQLGRYVYSGSKRGMADITSVINGKHVSIEIKTGKDRPRPEQLRTKSEIESAGGTYLFVRSFDDFLQQITAICNLGRDNQIDTINAVNGKFDNQIDTNNLKS
jgi:hypothetical protein